MILKRLTGSFILSWITTMFTVSAIAAPDAHVHDHHANNHHHEQEALARLEGPIVTINFTDLDGVGAVVGTVKLVDTRYGLLLIPDLEGLPVGPRDFHVHTNPTCGAAPRNGEMVRGLAAGGHFNPFNMDRHEGPYSENSPLGDMPPLVVSTDGTATIPVLAPRLEVQYLNGRSLMIHDVDGERLACGVIE